jgi:DNA-binding NarL/FixJ family response regulator
MPRPDDRRATCANVLVIEEHALLAAGLQLALCERGWQVETSSGQTAAEIVEHARRFQPQCVLLSTRLGSRIGSGNILIGTLVSMGAQVLLITAERRRTVLASALEAGVAGWIGKDAALDEVDSTLDRLVAGKPVIGKTIRASLLDELRLERQRQTRARATFEELTQREAHVLAAMSDGLTAEEIAREHFVAVCTIRSQIRAVLQKLEVRSQLAAVAVASAHRELLPHRGGTQQDRRRAPAREQGPEPELSVGIA